MKSNELGEGPRDEEVERALSLEMCRARKDLEKTVCDYPGRDSFIKPHARPKIEEAHGY
jgi:hypothetical protein